MDEGKPDWVAIIFALLLARGVSARRKLKKVESDMGQDRREDFERVAREARRREVLDQLFTYHPPKEGQPERYQRIRDAAKEFARVILEEAPKDGGEGILDLPHETTLALDRVSEAVMHANAAIARHE